MKIRTLILTLGMSAIVATSAFGQATRTWVSGVGDDVNPCSRTAPCKTFAGAISKTANGGQISVLDPGGFGAVTITKSITLEGGGELGSILNSGFNGIFINAGVNDNVIIRNLQIDGAGTGLAAIKINQAKTVTIEDTGIFNQGDASNGRGIDITPNAGFTANVYINDVGIYHCAVNGIRAAPAAGGAANVYIDEVRISATGSTTSHDGIDMQAGSNMTLNNVRVYGSAGSGFHVEASTATVDNSVFSHNLVDGITVGSGIALLRVSSSALTQNSFAGVRFTGSGQIFSYKNNRSSDNGLADSANTLAAFY
jgi:hypothetical protein